jgi:hypothetical protein
VFDWFSSSSRIWSTSVASASRAFWSEPPVLAPWSAISRARPTRSVTLNRVWSTRASRPRPSEAFRPYCSVALSEARSRIALVVSVGESEGRLIFLPVDSCS